MQAQRTELLALLPQHGWRVARIEEEPEWWADEIWELESVWSPAGFRAYITFLVDPQFEGTRKKGEGVWAVLASLYKPVSSLRGEYEHTFNLGQEWKDFVLVFFGFMTALRSMKQGR